MKPFFLSTVFAFLIALAMSNALGTTNAPIPTPTSSISVSRISRKYRPSATMSKERGSLMAACPQSARPRAAPRTFVCRESLLHRQVRSQ
ncbi:hypothetical protein EJ06DRAFT_278349 [Trichodelitschia bisporula]|uniref:Secreted protein n=1 Tax=Trichodelitschia bisporula TaxID=703511 RepID=A0A6G1I5V5_9PEZI|nr:hypothetical protein EJ06DRAFT_278349 [Trichodelitschia bisporula]